MIPENPLRGYKSHCWRETFNLTWNLNQQTISGAIGKVAFPTEPLGFYPYYRIFSALTSLFPSKSYESNIVCLPNVFQIGFEKCGSTFLYTYINNLISASTDDWKMRQIYKETQFWVRFEPYEESKIHLPKTEDIGRYLINFIPGIDSISRRNKTDLLLVDDTPNYISEWPVFNKSENNLSNYCLLPATLPMLFSDSKYLAIVRNPIDLVYSNFWWSCSKNKIKIPDPAKGPDIFHNRIMSKIQTFNDCMRDQSTPSISFPCSFGYTHTYASCIKKRLHLLDKCSADIIVNDYSPEMSSCGDSSLSLGIFYVHIRKWLDLVSKDNLLILTLEELTRHPIEVTRDILQFLDLDVTIARAEMVQYLMKYSDKNGQEMFIDYKGDELLHIRRDTKLALEEFYRPFNELLAQLLDSDKFIWF